MEMTVYINGKPEQRRVDYIESAPLCRRNPGPSYPMPVLKAGEEVRYTLSGQCHIIHTGER